MPTKIKPDYQPSQRVYELLKAFGVQNPVEFVGHELPDFMMYWEGRTDGIAVKSNWDSCCLKWMKRTYEDKKHAMAQNRVYGKAKPDIFADMLDKIETPVEQFEKIQRTVSPYKRPEIEIDPTMTTEDYLNELARMVK